MDLGAIIPQKRIDAMRGVWADKLVLDFLDAHVAAQPDKIALIDNNSQTGSSTALTYAELDDRSRRLAAGLRGRGLGPGDVLSLQMPNWWEFVALHLACVRLGVITNALMPIFRERELRFMLSFAEAKAYVAPAVFRGFNYSAMLAGLHGDLPALRRMLFVGGNGDQSFAALFESGPLARAGENRPAPNDVTQILYTSGTTGQPKGVMHTANTLFAILPGYAERLGLTGGDTFLMASPLGHQTGFMYGMLMPLMLGATVILQDVWSPIQAAELIQKHKVNYTMASTPFLTDLADLPTLGDYDMSSLRVFLSAGAPIPRSLVERAQKNLGAHILSGWGMTENGCVTSTAPGDPDDLVINTDGQAFPSCAVKIVDETGAEKPAGDEGALLVRASSQFVGYLKKPELYGVDDEGWFDSGDLARQDDNGYIRITGRAKDIVIRGAENIPIIEVEEALYRHPAIKELAIVGMPDERLGERCCLFAGLEDGATLTFDDMISFLSNMNMAKQYWPEKLVIKDALPRTPSGKIQKFHLREEAKGLTLED